MSLHALAHRALPPTAIGVLLLLVAPHLPPGALRAVLALAAMALVPGPALAAVVTRRAAPAGRAGLAAAVGLAWYAGSGVVVHALGGRIDTADVAGLSAVVGLLAAAAADAGGAATPTSATVGGGAAPRRHLRRWGAVVAASLAAALHPLLLPRPTPVEPPPFATPVDRDRPFATLALAPEALAASAGGTIAVAGGTLELPVDVHAVGAHDGPAELAIEVDGDVVGRRWAAVGSTGPQRLELRVPMPRDGCERRVVVRAGAGPAGPGAPRAVAVSARSGPAWTCRG